MPNSSLSQTLGKILAEDRDRRAIAAHITEEIRNYGNYRWVGVYDVDLARGLVSNIAWTGPNAPAYPVFCLTKGLTSRAIAERRTINVGDVAGDSDYLTALDSTRSEIIIPVFRDSTCSEVIGTIDVESDRVDAFDSATLELLERCAGQLAEFWRRAYPK
jgi:putative methionine-R-sulfoxide reductase with GAF domain